MDAFSGSIISDEQLTKQVDVIAIGYGPKGKGVLTGFIEGFAITELCVENGVYHNRQPMKITPSI